MIERFNFYDIYGYLLPGTLLLGLFWFPFGLATGSLPAKEVSTTLLLLVLAYIAGHILQTLASVVVPSDVPDEKGIRRALSSILLDASSTKFSKGFRKGLASDVKDAFGLDVLGDGQEELANRNTAFFEARAYLIRNKAANYVEQFEGLYVMMRGLSCAFFLGCAYLLGWGLSFHWQTNWLGACVWFELVVSSLASLLLSAAFLVLKKSPEAERVRDRWLTFCLLLLVLGLGYFLGTWKPLPGRLEFFLWSSLPVTLVAGSRCFQAYRSYALHFAETVWRDFSSLYREDARSSFKETHAKGRTASR
jgi:hypothetical protein